MFVEIRLDMNFTLFGSPVHATADGAASLIWQPLPRHVKSLWLRLPAWSQAFIRLSVTRVMITVSGLALMPKLKLLVAFYQTVSSLSTVYGARLPADYYRMMQAIDFFDLDWSGMVLAHGRAVGGV